MSNYISIDLEKKLKYTYVCACAYKYTCTPHYSNYMCVFVYIIHTLLIILKHFLHYEKVNRTSILISIYVHICAYMYIYTCNVYIPNNN